MKLKHIVWQRERERERESLTSDEAWTGNSCLYSLVFVSLLNYVR